MKPSSAKAKGRLFQQWVRDQLRWMGAREGLLDGDIESRSMGAGGTDVILSPAAQRIFPFAIECKRMAKISIYNWYKQASSHKKPGETIEPVLFIRADREEPLVVMSATYFLGMIDDKLEREGTV